MNHAVGRWLKVGVLTFVTAALVACAGAAGKPGAPGAPGAPGEPGAPAELPPVKVGTIADQTLVAAGTETVALGPYFTDPEGETLTYAAASSAEAFATVSVSGSTLTITAVVAGSAVITVTATDTDQLKATQSINVTVTAATTPPDPPVDKTITIGANEKTHVVDLAKYLDVDAILLVNYKLESRDVNVFTVAHKVDSMWTITAITEGTATAEIVAADGAPVETITVTVVNSAPELKLPLKVPAHGDVGDAVAHPAIKTKNNEDTEVALKLYKVSVKAGDYFTDADSSDILEYEITSQRQDVVIQTGEKCSASPCDVWLDIVARRVNEFNLNVEAVDSKNTKSPPLSFPFHAAKPVMQSYKTQQYATTFDFRAITVGRREGVNHDLFFRKVPSADKANSFAFAEAHVATVQKLDSVEIASLYDLKITEVDTKTDGKITTLRNVHYGLSKPPDPPENYGAKDGKLAVYTVKATGSVAGPAALRIKEAGEATPTKGVESQPRIKFQVTGLGVGTIEVGYHIWYDQDGTDEKHKARWYSAKKTLTVMVVAVK